MNTQWFLGANTADGFVSRFSQIQADHRIRKTIILKGGPGCGKSTFMKKLRETAQGLGADTESYPCASDPASLDGVLIIPLGLAIVDGTAPHVLEPQLCGCDGVYLNLGCFYDTQPLSQQKEKLLALRQENQQLYPAVYAHLSAAAALERCGREATAHTDPEGLYVLTQALLKELPSATHGRGRNREVFLRAYTPAGEIHLLESARALCHTCIAIEDPWGLASPLFARLRGHYLASNYDCITVLSPLSAEKLEGLIVPEAGIALLAGKSFSQDFPVTIRLGQYFKASKIQHELTEAAAAHCEKAVCLLKKAKAIHDEMEQLYRPYVSFEGLDLLTQEYQKQIKGELLSLG